MKQKQQLNEQQVKEIIIKNNLVIMRDKKTLKGLGLAYTEEGLRSTANKNGIYLYCKGRVNNYNDALIAPKSNEIIVEKFIPRTFKDSYLMKCEMHWLEAGLKKLY